MLFWLYPQLDAAGCHLSFLSVFRELIVLGEFGTGLSSVWTGGGSGCNTKNRKKSGGTFFCGVFGGTPALESGGQWGGEGVASGGVGCRFCARV